MEHMNRRGLFLKVLTAVVGVKLAAKWGLAPAKRMIDVTVIALPQTVGWIRFYDAALSLKWKTAELRSDIGFLRVDQWEDVKRELIHEHTR